MSMTDPAAAPRVEARLLRGFRDYLPAEMRLRNRLVATIGEVYERYGFAPIDTPAVEALDVLLGKYGEEGQKSIFRFATPDEEPCALRFDLTVPLARVVAQYPELPRPFRRYQVAPVWRGDKPGPGRFREFIQFDIDTVGSSSPAADVEILAAASEAFAALGLKGARIRLSSRRLLDALIQFAEVDPRRSSEVFRVLDKLDKQGLEAVKLELTAGRVDASGDRIPGLGLAAPAVERIERFLGVERSGRAGTLRAVEALLGPLPGAAAALAELDAIHRQLDALGIDEHRIVVDPTLARGLDYYTGPIFEAVLDQAPEFGSVFGGGRYDGLVERFLGQKLPATGGSIGIDRLAAALCKLELMPLRPASSEVLVAVLDPSMLPEYQKMAAELRAAGIPAEVYLGDQRGLKKQLAYADKLQIPVALLLGGDELARGEVAVKDLLEGARKAAGAAEAGRDQYLKERFGQRSVARGELVATVRALLGR